MHLMRQKSESKLFKAVERLRPKDDKRPLLLACGAWGLKPGTICRKGNQPSYPTAIGVWRQRVCCVRCGEMLNALWPQADRAATRLRKKRQVVRLMVSRLPCVAPLDRNGNGNGK